MNLKKTIAAWLGASMVLPTMMIPSANAVLYNRTLDLNRDGKLSVADVIVMQKFLLNEPNAGFQDWQFVDFDDNGVINAVDYSNFKSAFRRYTEPIDLPEIESVVYHVENHAWGYVEVNWNIFAENGKYYLTYVDTPSEINQKFEISKEDYESIMRFDYTDYFRSVYYSHPGMDAPICKLTLKGKDGTEKAATITTTEFEDRLYILRQKYYLKTEADNLICLRYSISDNKQRLAYRVFAENGKYGFEVINDNNDAVLMNAEITKEEYDSVLNYDFYGAVCQMTAEEAQQYAEIYTAYNDGGWNVSSVRFPAFEELLEEIRMRYDKTDVSKESVKAVRYTETNRNMNLEFVFEVWSEYDEKTDSTSYHFSYTPSNDKAVTCTITEEDYLRVVQYDYSPYFAEDAHPHMVLDGIQTSIQLDYSDGSAKTSDAYVRETGTLFDALYQKYVTNTSQES